MAKPGDNFGDRMKGYEALETERRFMPLLPVYARIDGRCFSSFTHGMRRPFDQAFSRAMVETTKALVYATHARIGYTQSDEISLVWMQERSDSELFFDGKIQKMVSVLAGLASATFCRICLDDEYLRGFAVKHAPHFDCRAFQLPNTGEAANAFLWREQDATKNAISMAARSMYSHNELNGKSGAVMQEMIFQKGQNFNDYPNFFKRGTFVRRTYAERTMTADELARIPEKHRPDPDAKHMRSEIVCPEMPPFSKVENRVAVIFDGADPVVGSA